MSRKPVQPVSPEVLQRWKRARDCSLFTVVAMMTTAMVAFVLGMADYVTMSTANTGIFLALAMQAVAFIAFRLTGRHVVRLLDADTNEAWRKAKAALKAASNPSLN